MNVAVFKTLKFLKIKTKIDAYFLFFLNPRPATIRLYTGFCIITTIRYSTDKLFFELFLRNCIDSAILFFIVFNITYKNIIDNFLDIQPFPIGNCF